MNIIKPEQPLPPEKLVAVIYGPPGVAKTSLAFTADNPILFDFDQGVKRAVGRKDINKIGRYEEIIEMIEKDQMRGLGYKTAIIDTGGNLLDRFASDFVCRVDFKNKNASGGLTLSGYGAIQQVFKKLMDYLRGLDMDIVIICHGVEKEGAGDSLRLRPRMTGGSYNIMMELADMVGYMEMLNDKVTINFNPTDKHVGKNCGELAPIQLPHYLKPDWDGFLAKLINTTREKIETLTEEQRNAVGLVSNLTNEINGFTTPEQFDEVSKRIATTPEWCRVALSKIMRDKIALLGIRYNKTDNKFELIPIEPVAKVQEPAAEKIEAKQEEIKTPSNKEYQEKIGEIQKKVKPAKNKTAEALTDDEFLLLELFKLGVFNDKAYKALESIRFYMTETGNNAEGGLKYYIEEQTQPQANP